MYLIIYVGTNVRCIVKVEPFKTSLFLLYFVPPIAHADEIEKTIHNVRFPRDTSWDDGTFLFSYFNLSTKIKIRRKETNKQ